MEWRAHCYRIAYPSQRETADDHAARRAERIRERLGWEPSILNGEGGKPKGMSWYTFERLTAEHEAFVGEVAGRDGAAAGDVERVAGLNLFRKKRSQEGRSCPASLHTAQLILPEPDVMGRQ